MFWIRMVCGWRKGGGGGEHNKTELQAFPITKEIIAKRSDKTVTNFFFCDALLLFT